ncbi:MAG: methyltransferase domain-containing protein [Nitrospirae bacterium]|nr:methyltransferase domain-containing protein [Nitrospirota bacterium]
MTDSADLYQVLVCPYEGTKLESFIERTDMADSDNDEGILFCRYCKRIWTVIEGIPRFVTEGNVDLHRDIEILEALRNSISEIDGSTFDDNINMLMRWQQTAQKGWAYDEMNYWEDYYEKKLDSAETPGEIRSTYNRLLPRKRHILSVLDSQGPITNVIEVGCGTAGVMSAYQDFIKNKIYFGTDLSFNALRIAKRRIKGHFILCDAGSLPFRNGFFDAMLGFGVLHHLPRHEESLLYLLSKVAGGGWLGFNEKIKTPESMKNSFIVKALKILFMKSAREHGSEEYIDCDNLFRILKGSVEFKNIHYEYSIVRDALVMLLVNSLGINIKPITEMVIRLDEAAIKFLGKSFDIFGPKNILFVARKKDAL